MGSAVNAPELRNPDADRSHHSQHSASATGAKVHGRRWPVFAGGADRGGRYWRYKYRYAGKYKTLALGIFPDVSLDKARLRHQGAHRWLAAGIDPALKKRQLRSACRKSNFDARPQIKCS